MGEFLNQGYKERYFFPHRFYFLPKCGPDGFKMARRMCKVNDPNKSWELVLYAADSAIDPFPKELFFDRELIWHQHQFGKPGQVATANLVVKGNSVYGMNYLSDLVQRISRRREFKTKIENRFKGWHHMLLNAIMNFAIERGLKKIYSPTSEFTIQHIPRSRQVRKELFERIYDEALHKHFRVTRQGSWWLIDVADNSDRVVVAQKSHETIENGKTICLCHDIERGWGHVDLDTNLANLAERNSPKHLQDMLGIEREMDIKGTYNVVGRILGEVRDSIEKDGHCIGFHSYDHKTDKLWSISEIHYKVLSFLGKSRTKEGKNGHADQLARVRQIDYRIKGYRPPQSKITKEISDNRLCFHNFEWLASSAYSFGIRIPKMENRIVKIPLLFDDFAMYKNGLSYAEWEQKALEHLRQNEFVAFSLHDVYAHYWLSHHKQFLDKISAFGKFKTLDEVANAVIFSAAE